MINNDYKTMTEDKLKEILIHTRQKAEELMEYIVELKNTANNKEYKIKLQDINAEYALIKNNLKEMYNYVQLTKNQESSVEFYNSYFCHAIIDCYVHCDAKINGTNIDKLYSTLYDISDYIQYYLPD